MKKKSILYWMNRDQRAFDNKALLKAQEKALCSHSRLSVIFNILNSYKYPYTRHFYFMIENLKEVEVQLKNKNINFIVTLGNPIENILKYIDKNEISEFFTDFHVLRNPRRWRKELKSKLSKMNVKFNEVDAHNIVPCKLVSGHQEYAARTIRPKIQKLLPEYLKPLPELQKMPKDSLIASKDIDWEKLLKKLNLSEEVNKIQWIKSGYEAGMKTLDHFIKTQLINYSERKNDPNEDVLSNLSPYLHFGQISSQKVGLEINKIKNNSNSDKFKKSCDVFLEELIVRKELADNFCYYNSNYDNFQGFPDWAQKSLKKHKSDKREFIYSLEEFENSETHDSAWNAAQNQMVKTGKMHGYMRMYWAKKILEWSNNPEIAQKKAVFLNDKYSLDGRDPNGYTGIAWAIGGVHDQGWKEREVYGKVRYMNFNGLKRKFDVKKYISKYN